MKWPKSEEFSDFHTENLGVNMSFQGAAGAVRKMGALSRRSAATDGEKYPILRSAPRYFGSARRDLSNGTRGVR